MTALLKLTQIVTDAGTQVRASLDESTVETYATNMTDGDNFPPVVVFHDGSKYFLADGFHRVIAATRCGILDTQADIHRGTRSDAIRYALSANAKHGLRRSNADKRRSVEIALGEWPNLSDREIGRICAVSDHLVADARKINCENLAVESRIGSDGKARKVPTARKSAFIGSAPVETVPEPEPTTERTHEGDVEQTESTTDNETDGVATTRPCPFDSAPHAFAVQIEDIVTDAIETATIEQLHSLKGSVEVAVKRVAAEIKRRGLK